MSHKLVLSVYEGNVSVESCDIQDLEIEVKDYDYGRSVANEKEDHDALMFDDDGSPYILTSP